MTIDGGVSDINSESLPVTGGAPNVDSGGHSVSAVGQPDHIVQFYDDDAHLCDVVADFLGTGIAAGQPTLVIATESHREALTRRLECKDIDVADALRGGRLNLLDATETLATFMVGGMPDVERFRVKVGGIVEQHRVGNGHTCLRAYGEMVDVLCKDGNPEAAIRLEELWHDLLSTRPFSLLCGYSKMNSWRRCPTNCGPR